MLGFAPAASAATDSDISVTAAPAADLQLKLKTGEVYNNVGVVQPDDAAHVFANLDAGTYQVEASQTGCDTATSADIVLTGDDASNGVAAFNLKCDYVPLEPKRLLETRPQNNAVTPHIDHINPAETVPAGNVTQPIGNSITKVIVRGGSTTVPANAVGVSLNVTGVGSTNTDNYLTVWDCTDSPVETTSLELDPPLASNLNLAESDTRPNAVITKVGAGDLICIYTRRAVHLIVDITGYFPAGSGAQMTFDPAPVRLLETRGTNGSAVPPITKTNYNGSKPVAGDVLRFNIGSSDVDAIINVTGTQATGGYVTVWDCTDTIDGTSGAVEPDPPTTSTLNLENGMTAANLAITGTNNGEICLYTSGSTHLIVDRIGYFHPDAGQVLPSLASEYTSLLPRRVLETRATNLSSTPPITQIGYGSPTRPLAGSKIVLDLDLDPDGPLAAPVPGGTKAVVLNVTGTQSNGGYVTVYSCDNENTPVPTASNLNLVANQSRPNLVVSEVSDTGKVCLFTQGASHLIADLVGYFPG